MESLTDQPSLNSSATADLTPLAGPAKPSVKGPDRITLGPVEVRKVDQWLKQIHEASKGFLGLSRSELVNFLIREHRDELLPNELKRVRADHYDPIKHMQWIMPQIKEAWGRADTLRVVELQEELRGVEISTTRTPSESSGVPDQGASRLGTIKKKGRKSKTQADADGAADPSENADSIAKIDSIASGTESF